MVEICLTQLIVKHLVSQTASATLKPPPWGNPGFLKWYILIDSWESVRPEEPTDPVHRIRLATMGSVLPCENPPGTFEVPEGSQAHSS